MLFCLLPGLQACKSVAPVVEVHYKDSIRTVYQYRHDTTYIDRWHSEKQVGDTIYKTDSIYVFEGAEVEVHDTITVNNTDTITNVEYREKELSKLQQAAMNSGYATWAFLALLVLTLIVVVIYKLARR